MKIKLFLIAISFAIFSSCTTSVNSDKETETDSLQIDSVDFVHVDSVVADTVILL